MNTIDYVKLIAETAREVNKEDPIDFGMCQIDERRIWDLMASHIVERYLPYKDTETATMMYLATITKLVVENFVLNYKLREKNYE